MVHLVPGVFESPLQITIYTSAATILAVVFLRGVLLIRQEGLKQRRVNLELDFESQMNAIRIKEYAAKLEREGVEGRSAEQSRGGDPGIRIGRASQAGTLFEPIEDAVAELQLRLAYLDIGQNDEAALTRYLPVSLYVARDDPKGFYELYDALAQLLETFGFEVVSETPVRRGSIFQSLTAKLKSPATQAELKRQARLAQLAIQQQQLGRVQAEINAKQAGAAAAVHGILKEHDEYVILFGSIVGATHRDGDGRRRSMIVELTPDELIEFQRNGSAIDDAASVLERLRSLRPEEALRGEAAQAPRLDPPAQRDLPPGD